MKVGTFTVIIMFVNIFSTVFIAFVTKFGKGCMKKKSWKKMVLQKDLNELMIGSEFNMHFAYSKILAFLYITLIFGPGMPLLYILFTAYLSFQYYTDKYMGN